MVWSSLCTSVNSPSVISFISQINQTEAKSDVILNVTKNIVENYMFMKKKLKTYRDVPSKIYWKTFKIKRSENMTFVNGLIHFWQYMSKDNVGKQIVTKFCGKYKQN